MDLNQNHPPSAIEVVCLDAQDVAESLGVSTRTVDRLRESGTLSYRRVGSQIRFTPQDVAEFLDSIRVSAAS